MEAWHIIDKEDLHRGQSGCASSATAGPGKGTVAAANRKKEDINCAGWTFIANSNHGVVQEGMPVDDMPLPMITRCRAVLSASRCQNRRAEYQGGAGSSRCCCGVRSVTCFDHGRKDHALSSIAIDRCQGLHHVGQDDP